MLCKLDGNILPIIFKEHTHQTEMTRQALRLVKTRNVSFVEHDTPFCEDIPIDDITNMLDDGTAKMVRVNHEALVHPEHEHLYLSGPTKIGKSLFRQTVQWSQRPHFSKTDFYIEILDKYFSKDARCMIEDGIHGKVVEDYNRKGKSGWNDWRVWTYTPEGDQKRSIDCGVSNVLQYKIEIPTRRPS